MQTVDRGSKKENTMRHFFTEVVISVVILVTILLAVVGYAYIMTP